MDRVCFAPIPYAPRTWTPGSSTAGEVITTKFINTPQSMETQPPPPLMFDELNFFMEDSSNVQDSFLPFSDENSMDVLADPSNLLPLDMGLDQSTPCDGVDFTFWNTVAVVMSKIAGKSQDTEFYENVIQHCRNINLYHEPSEHQILAWINNDFTTIFELQDFQPGSFQLSFSVFPDDVIDDDTLCQHLSWNQMTAFRRYYYLYCTFNWIHQEKSQSEDPYLEPWCLQYLISCILFGSDYMVKTAQSLLEIIDANTWCNEYMYCGGLVRDGIISYLSQNNSEFLIMKNDLSCLETVIKFILTTMSESKGVSHWVAFFEQVENWLVFKDFLGKYLQATKEPLPILVILYEKISKISTDDFMNKRMRQGIFKTVKSYTNQMVELEYHGCPKSIMVPREKITDVKILQCISVISSSQQIGLE